MPLVSSGEQAGGGRKREGAGARDLPSGHTENPLGQRWKKLSQIKGAKISFIPYTKQLFFVCIFFYDVLSNRRA
jgi:hypothetical protein